MDYEKMLEQLHSEILHLQDMKPQVLWPRVVLGMMHTIETACFEQDTQTEDGQELWPTEVWKNLRNEMLYLQDTQTQELWPTVVLSYMGFIEGMETDQRFERMQKTLDELKQTDWYKGLMGIAYELTSH